MWMKSNWGGTSRCRPGPSLVSSLSTARSHRVTWPSEPDAANTEASVGCHSTDVMGAVWCLNIATETPLVTEKENGWMNE